MKRGPTRQRLFLAVLPAVLSGVVPMAAPSRSAPPPATRPEGVAPAEGRAGARAKDQAKPRDDTADWLLNQGATTAPPRPDESPGDRPPAPTPAAAPADPRERQRQEHRKVVGARKGVIVTSDGEKIKGYLSTTLDKPVRVWDEQKQAYRDLPFALIKTVEAKVLWERQEPEWHFKESGSDIKEYSGKSYPARETQYAVTLVNGQGVTGGIASPLYLETPSGDKVFVLHKRDKGEVGQTLAQLVYVKRVELEE